MRSRPVNPGVLRSLVRSMAHNKALRTIIVLSRRKCLAATVIPVFDRAITTDVRILHTCLKYLSQIRHSDPPQHRHIGPHFDFERPRPAVGGAIRSSCNHTAGLHACCTTTINVAVLRWPPSLSNGLCFQDEILRRNGCY